jgi:hypothetical protein
MQHLSCTEQSTIMKLLRIALPLALSFATFIAHAEPKT